MASSLFGGQPRTNEGNSIRKLLESTPRSKQRRAKKVEEGRAQIETGAEETSLAHRLGLVTVLGTRVSCACY